MTRQEPSHLDIATEVGVGDLQNADVGESVAVEKISQNRGRVLPGHHEHVVTSLDHLIAASRRAVAPLRCSIN